MQIKRIREWLRHWRVSLNYGYDEGGDAKYLVGRASDPTACDIEGVPESVRDAVLELFCKAFNIPLRQMHCLRREDELAAIYRTFLSPWGLDLLEFDVLLFGINKLQGPRMSVPELMELRTVGDVIRAIALRGCENASPRQGILRVMAMKPIRKWLRQWYINLTYTAYDRRGNAKYLIGRAVDPAACDIPGVTAVVRDRALRILCKTFNIQLRQIHCLRPEDELMAMYRSFTGPRNFDQLEFEALWLELDDLSAGDLSESEFYALKTVGDVIRTVAARMGSAGNRAPNVDPREAESRAAPPPGGPE